MVYRFIRRLFTGLLALIAFFVNLTATPSTKDTPPDAVSLVYADTAWGDVKLFMPESPDAEKPLDVLFTIHGGAWVSGHAGIFYKHCRAAAASGYAAASMNYDKIFNGADGAQMVNEVGLAIAAVKAELESRGLRPGKLILAGHSAGAHIMLLYAATQKDACPMEIAFTVSNSAATDFLAARDDYTAMIGRSSCLILSGLTGELVTPLTIERNRDAIRAVTPLELITPDMPPTIVVYGTKDRLIPAQNSVSLYAKLQENGVDSVLIPYEGAGHFLGDKYTEANEARSAAFYAFAEKYGS